jgi:hypothetical protein
MLHDFLWCVLANHLMESCGSIETAPVKPRFAKTLQMLVEKRVLGMQSMKHSGQTVVTPASCVGRPCFKFWPGEPPGFSWFSLVF